MRMLLACLILLPVLCMAFSAPPVHADDPLVVRVGLYENEPKIFTDSSGNPSGFWPELLKHIAETENWQVIYVPGTWEECLDRLERGEIDIMPDVAYTEARAALYQFSSEIVVVSWSRIYTRKGAGIESVLDLEEKTLAVLVGSVNVDGPEGVRTLLEAFDINCTLLEADTYAQVFEMVAAGDADGAVASRDFANRHIHSYDLFETPILFQPAHLHFAFNIDSAMTPSLVNAIDDYIRVSRTDNDSRYYQALEHWLGFFLPAEEVLPRWLLWTLVGIGGLVALLFASGFLLKNQVSRRTRQLTAEIAERERVQQEAVKLQHLLSETQAISKLGGWEYDTGTEKFSWTDEVYDIYGVDRDYDINNINRNIGFYAPGDDTVIKDAFNLAVAEGKPYDLELKFIRVDGREIWVRTTARAEMVDNRVVRVVGNIMDITDGKEAEKELRAQEEFVRTLVDNVPLGLAVYTAADGKTIFTNQKFEEIYGWPKETLTDVESFFQHVYPDPEYRQEIQQKITADIDSGDVSRMDWDNIAITTAAGETRFVHASNFPLREQGLMIATVQDVTARKQAEETLKESEHRFRTLFDNASVGIVIHDRDTGEIITANHRRLEMHGCETLEELKTSIFNHSSPFSPEDALNWIHKAAREGRQRFEWQNSKKNGELFWEDVVLEAHTVDGVERVIATTIDITERKQAEIALTESEQRFRLLFDNSLDAILLTIPDGKVVAANPAACRMFQRTEEEICALGRDGLVDIDDPRVPVIMEERQRTGQFQGEINFKRADGTVFPVEGSSRIFTLPNGELRSVMTLHDITTRKQAEEELRLLLEGSNAIIGNRDFEETARIIFSHCKKVTGAVSGYIALLSEDGAENEILFLDSGGAPCDVDPHLPMPIRGLRETAYRKQQTVYENNFAASEWLQFMPAGHVHLENVLFAPLVIDNRAVGLIGLANKPGGFDEKDARLVTAFGNMVAASLDSSRMWWELAENEEKYRRLSLLTSDVSYSCSVEPGGSYSIDWMAGAVEKITGYTAEEVKAHSCWKFLVTQEDVPVFEKNVTGLKPGESAACEMRIRCKDDSVIWIMAQTECILDDEISGRLRLYGGITDITERKMAEVALTSSETKFRSLYENMTEGVALHSLAYDDEGRVTDYTVEDVNISYERLLGISRQEAIGQRASSLYGTGQPPYLTAYARVALTGKPYSFETFFTPMKKYLTISVFSPAEGKFATVFTDITERKRAEEALRENERFLTTLIANLPGTVYRCKLDEQWTMLYLSAGCAALTGYPPEELLGNAVRSYEDITHPEDRRRVRETIELAVEEKTHWQTGYRIITAADEVRWVWEQGRAVYSGDGNVLFLEGFISDITSEVEIREALVQSEERFRTMVNSMEDIIFTLDRDMRHTGVFGPWVERSGLTPEHFLGKTSREILGDEAAVVHEAAARQALAGESVVYEWQALSGDETQYYQTSLSPIYTDDGSIIGLVGIGRDITERKQAEEALRESELRFRTLADSGQAIIWTAGTDKLCDYFNQPWLTFTGRTLEQELGNGWTEGVHPDDLDRCLEIFTTAFDKRERFSMIYRLHHASGDYRWIQDDGTPRYNSQGEFIGYIGHCLDITSHQQIEQALRQSEENYRRSMDESPLGIRIISPAGATVYANRAMLDIYGYETLEELNSVPTRDRYTIGSYAEHVFRKGKRLRGETVPSNYEVSIKRRNGSIRHLDVFRKEVLWNGEIQAQATYIDITEQKLTEIALNNEASRRRVLMEQSRDGIVILKDDGSVYEANSRFAEMLGYSPAEVLHLHIWDWDGNWSVKELKEMLRTVDEQGDYFETRHRRKDGSLFDVAIATNGAVFEGQKLIYCICRDITLRKQSEAALRESEEKFSKSFHASPSAISISHVSDGVFIDVNDTYTRLTGFSREEIIGHTALELGMFIDESQLEAIRTITENREKLSGMEFEFRTKKGVIRTWLASTEYITIAGEPCLLMELDDITERKQAEESIRESEEKFSHAFQSSPSIMTITTDQGEYIDVNGAFTRITGYTREEVIGKTVHSLNVWANPEQRQQAAQIFVKKGRVAEYEYELRTKSGDIRTMIFSMEPMTLSGKPARLAVSTDITERKRIERALRVSDTAFRSLHDAVIVMDNDWNVVEWNHLSEEVFGIKEKNAIGKFIGDLMVMQEDYPGQNGERIKLLTKRGWNREEQRYQTPRGEIWVDVHSQAVQDSKGNRQGWVTLAVDITERKQMEERMLITDRLVSIGELASGIAHELNNPLTGIIGLSELLLDADVPEDVKTDLEMIHREAERTSKVARNLLTFARKHPLKKEKIQVNDAVKAVLELRAYELRVNNVEVVTDFAAGLPDIMADGFQLQQVFLNIIINAEYFMKEAHGRGKLIITTRLVNSMISAAFTDDGPGIPKENLKQLFNPFYTSKEVGKGTGLGLSICHGIITEHGGRIYAESELGSGATFVVELPVAGE